MVVSHLRWHPEMERFAAALKRKYDYEPSPEDRAKAWLFKLAAR